jgi:hypothetical protein
VEEMKKDLIESPGEGNQEQKPPPGLLAGVGHEDAFAVHDAISVVVSVAKLSLFFRMTNKLCKMFGIFV